MDMYLSDGVKIVQWIVLVALEPYTCYHDNGGTTCI